MQTDNQIYEYLQKIHTYIEKQNKKIKEVEKNIKKLQDELNKLKERPTNIEYKFDQLKVENLTGTLNIGISPTGDNIEDFAVNNPEHKAVEEKYLKLSNDIKKEIDEYLSQEGFNLISQANKNHNKDLDNSYNQLILDDINKQLSQRIQLYINQLGKEASIENTEEVKDSIVKKIKNDIIVAINTFIKHLPVRE